MFDGPDEKPKRGTPEWQERYQRLTSDVIGAVDCWMITRELIKTKPDLDIGVEEGFISTAILALNDFLGIKYPSPPSDGDPEEKTA